MPAATEMPISRMIEIFRPGTEDIVTQIIILEWHNSLFDMDPSTCENTSVLGRIRRAVVIRLTSVHIMGNAGAAMKTWIQMLLFKKKFYSAMMEERSR